jgi:hypothetical protein
VNDVVTDAGQSYVALLNNINAVDPASDVSGNWALMAAAGAAGAVGAAGSAGATGATGAIGPAGPAGSPGAAGTNGAPGGNGATGPAGPAGPTGPAGTTGIFGTNTVSFSGGGSSLACTVGSISLNVLPVYGTNYLPADGSTVHPSDLPDLFSAIGNTYGGDGSNNTFVLPNLTAAAPNNTIYLICATAM